MIQLLYACKRAIGCAVICTEPAWQKVAYHAVHDVAVEAVVVPHFSYFWVLEERLESPEDGLLLLLRTRQQMQRY